MRRWLRRILSVLYPFVLMLVLLFPITLMLEKCTSDVEGSYITIEYHPERGERPW